MIASPPITLVADTPVSVADPLGPSGTPSAALQLQNQTGFTLAVLAAGELLTIQSLTAKTVDLARDGSAITVTPNSPTVDVQLDQLSLVWLLPGESPPMDDGPLSATSIGVSLVEGSVSISGGTVDVNPGTAPLNVGPEESLVASGVTGASGGTGYVETFAVKGGVNTVVLVLGATPIVAGMQGFLVGNNSDAVQVIQFPDTIPPGSLYPNNGGVSFPVPVFTAGAIDTHITVRFPIVPTGVPFWIIGSNDYYSETVNVEGDVSVTTTGIKQVETLPVGGRSKASGSIASGGSAPGVLNGPLRIHSVLGTGPFAGPPPGSGVVFSLDGDVCAISTATVPMVLMGGMILNGALDVTNGTGGTCGWSVTYDGVVL